MRSPPGPADDVRGPPPPLWWQSPDQLSRCHDTGIIICYGGWGSAGGGEPVSCDHLWSAANREQGSLWPVMCHQNKMDGCTFSESSWRRVGFKFKRFHLEPFCVCSAPLLMLSLKPLELLHQLLHVAVTEQAGPGPGRNAALHLIRERRTLTFKCAHSGLGTDQIWSYDVIIMTTQDQPPAHISPWSGQWDSGEVKSIKYFLPSKL